jgi:hypothetical protein
MGKTGIGTGFWLANRRKGAAWKPQVKMRKEYSDGS